MPDDPTGTAASRGMMRSSSSQEAGQIANSIGTPMFAEAGVAASNSTIKRMTV
jgi:hypothetical protein